MPNSKASLRKHFLQIRKDINDFPAQSAAVNAADNFINALDIDGIQTIAIYSPIKGEIDPMPLLERVAAKITSQTGEAVISLMPKISKNGNGILFYPWNIGDKLLPNKDYPQLMEPKAAGKHIVPDIIIVPLVAFDENCHRLGYGAGFYDRAIAKLRKKGERRGEAGRVMTNHSSIFHPYPLIVGYAYDCQKTSISLPADPHDMQLDFVVTEKQLYSAG